MVTGQNESSSEAHRVLVTALGVNPQPVRYELRGETYEAKLAPVALVNLLPREERPREIYALCTEKSGKDTYDLLVQQLTGICDVRKIDIPDGETEQALPEFLGKVTKALPTKSALELIVDFTHGYRHHTFLTFMAVLYVSALRRVRIRAAYYGLFSGPPRQSTAHETPAPVTTGYLLDVRPLLELPRWFHAVEMLDTTGSAEAMARLIDEHMSDAVATESVGLLRRLTESYQSGLPLELGRDVGKLRAHAKPFKRLLKEHDLPLADELVDQILHRLASFQLATPPTGPKWKQTVPLHEEELRRQAALIDSLIQSGALPSAYGLMREWMVSWVLWRGGDTSQAWKRDARRAAENQLGRLRQLLTIAPELLSEEQRWLAQCWKDVTDIRNAYHHHGMRGETVSSSDSGFQERITQVAKHWQKLQRCPAISLDLPVESTGTILVSPIGTRPGALYSAVEAARSRGHEPDRCLVICSENTEASAQEALDRAGFTGQRDLVRLRDPFGGVEEFTDVVEQRVQVLLGADRVYVNLTGGTTLMGLLADRFAQRAQELGPQVHRFGLVDRRSPAEQAADPYQAGEPYWLDDDKERA